MHSLLQQILTRVRREQFEPWFRSLVLVRFDEREVEISVTSQFVRDWLLKNYLATIQESVTASLGGKRRILLTLREEDGHDNLRLLPMLSGQQQVSPEQLGTQQGTHQQGTHQQGTQLSAQAGGDDPGQHAGGHATAGHATAGHPSGGQPSAGHPAGGHAGTGHSHAHPSRATDPGSWSGSAGPAPVPIAMPGSSGGGLFAKHDRSPVGINAGGTTSSGSTSGPTAPGVMGTGGAHHAQVHGSSMLTPSLPAPVPGQAAARRLRPAQLNANYTFERFVVGPCNRLAHASALAIGENPGCAYNPLFIHGNVGLGKSHLLQAICHTIMRREPGARVLYLSCEDFTNTFINAIQNGSLDDFRNFHRSVDVLVIDDVQFLANKEKTQDEFFHTFNSLYDAQKQIVMSSDRSPLEIPTIEGRLVSRFKWGLVAEIEAPCYETRVAIVRRKAKGRGIDLSEEVAQYIAERITVNIRELEGAVIKVVGVAAITGRQLSCELAEEALRGIAAIRHAQVSADDVMNLITSEFAISARDLTGKSRTQVVSLPRQIAMFLLRGHTELSLEDIGRFFGNRDHTTVLYAVTKIRDRSQKDRMFKELLEGLSNRLLARGFR